MPGLANLKIWLHPQKGKETVPSPLGGRIPDARTKLSGKTDVGCLAVYLHGRLSAVDLWEEP
jgi:hypothetical protein